MIGALEHRLALAGIALLAASLVAPVGSTARGPIDAGRARIDVVTATLPFGERSSRGDEGPGAPTEVEPEDGDDSADSDGPSSGPATLAHRARELAAPDACHSATHGPAAPLPRRASPRAARGPPPA